MPQRVSDTEKAEFDPSCLAGKYLLVDLESEMIVSTNDAEDAVFRDATEWTEESLGEGANPPAMAIYRLEKVLIP